VRTPEERKKKSQNITLKLKMAIKFTEVNNINSQTLQGNEESLKLCHQNLLHRPCFGLLGGSDGRQERCTFEVYSPKFNLLKIYKNKHDRI